MMNHVVTREPDEIADAQAFAGEQVGELLEAHGRFGDLVERLLHARHRAVPPPRRHAPRRPALQQLDRQLKVQAAASSDALQL